MASGTPDYIREVREKFGSVKTEIGSKIVTANDATILTAITGKGVLYGANIRLDHNASQKSGGPLIWIDTSVQYYALHETLIKYNLCQGVNSLLKINVYDEENYIYSTTFTGPLKFESQITLLYWELDGGIPTVYWDIVYALL